MNISYITESRSFKYGFAAFLFLVVSLSFLRKIYDYDVWFHLAIGREILANLRIPQTEVFVYTSPGYRALTMHGGLRPCSIFSMTISDTGA